MRVAVLFYHKNIGAIYKKEWIEECVNSIKEQTYQDFDVLELNYGGTESNYAYGVGKTHRFFAGELTNHIWAMNYLIDLAFREGYDVVMNTNMDDIYAKDRFEKQISVIQNGFQLVSSDFYHMQDGNIIREMQMSKRGDIGMNLRKNHNLIAHPCVAMHRSFWTDGLKYRDLLGYEDLDLWQRAHKAGKRFYIIPENLLFYRLHTNQITKKYEGKPTNNRHK